jgi:hypothetical protein
VVARGADHTCRLEAAGQLYFGLTPHEKPSQFERTVQALIYTAVVQALVALEKLIATRIGEWHSYGEWTEVSQWLAAVTSALALGFIVTTATNHDLVHGALRKRKLTTRTSHPGEWFTIFSDYSEFIVLHLKDKSSVHGWPSMWPATSEKGHFLLAHATRTLPDSDQGISQSHALVINVADVVFVEFTTPKLHA